MRRKEQDTRILTEIEQIKKEHPFWGYRRIWAYLKYRQDKNYNRKRIYRIMKEHNLLVKPNSRLKAKREKNPNKSKPHASRPNQFWGIDMTKVLIPNFGWIYLIIVLDWFSKKLIGYYISSRCRTQEWLDAFSPKANPPQAENNACDNQFPQGITFKQKELFLVSDNGSQPTSKLFMQACYNLGIKQIFASYNNPKGNADTERIMRTIKEDFVWTREFSSPIEFAKEFKLWVDDYNNDFPHSSLKYQTPLEFEREYFEKEHLALYDTKT